MTSAVGLSEPGGVVTADTVPTGTPGTYDRRMSDTTETTPGWLAPDELELTRARMPILYVEAVPVRVDGSGEVTHVGLLLRIGPDGTVSRTLVSGRVLHHERIRDALLRHLEKDLGVVALPQIPASLQPYTVAGP